MYMFILKISMAVVNYFLPPLQHTCIWMNTHPFKTMAHSSCDSPFRDLCLCVCVRVCVCVVSSPEIFPHQPECGLKVEHKSFPPTKSVLRVRTALCQVGSTKSFVSLYGKQSTMKSVFRNNLLYG